MNRAWKFLIALFVVYLVVKMSMTERFQEKNVYQGKNPIHPIFHVTTPNSNSIYSTKFRSNLPEKNIKFRPENELGNISSDHLVYDT
jgi:hypothetical protein